eukprot:scaffold2288_cov87-Cylindrotheca_fusiformis.AAC.2
MINCLYLQLPKTVDYRQRRDLWELLRRQHSSFIAPLKFNGDGSSATYYRQAKYRAYIENPRRHVVPFYMETRPHMIVEFTAGVQGDLNDFDDHDADTMDDGDFEDALMDIDGLGNKPTVYSQL